MTILHDHTVVERDLAVSPLGIRFWDSAADVHVDSGLRVTAWPEVSEESDLSLNSRSTAFRSFSGLYVFRDLPGLRSFEHPSEFVPAPIVPGSLPEPRTFMVEVRDLQRRFVPVVFEVELPRTERGVFPTVNGGSLPDDGPPGFFLFSSVSRTPLSGIAVLRAHLVDEITLAPAAHAVLDVEVEGRQSIGLADEQGRAAVMFSYPALTVALSGSFPEGGTPLHEYEWAMSVRVRYEPSRQRIPAGSTLPTLRSILAQQYGLVYAVEPESSPETEPAESLPATLRFSEEAIVRTQHRSDLLVQPATSIP